MALVCERQEKLVIRFEGNLETARCAELEAEVYAAAEAAPGEVVFDVGQVEFISSAFLRLCIGAQRRAGTRGFRVVHPTPSIKRVLKIAGLDAMLGEV